MRGRSGSTTMTELSLGEARRLALGAQGFDRPRPRGPVGLRDLRALVDRLGLLQLDYVNVLAPAHFHVPFSRLGAYDRALLHDLVYRRREFTEQWAHEASIVPAACWPLLRHRMARHRLRPYGFEKLLARHPGYAEHVLDQVRARGPLAASEIVAPDGAPRRVANSWFGSVPRATLEAHFGQGRLAIADRRDDFARVYDLTERVIAAEHLEVEVPADEAQRELLARAGRAHGVGTARDLADYYRIPVREARPRLAELVEQGVLAEARVEGWREPAYLDPGARAPRRVEAAALLSPFDPLVWCRPRAERLFGFEYRFEIFVPPAQRRWGVYVLPFLFGERLVARVDLKADRERGRLRVGAAYAEPKCATPEMTAALARELRALAAWLGLESVSIGRRGDLARALSAELST